jgi:hypothetical protein
MLLLLIVGIAASVQSGNSTDKSIIPSGIAMNIINQTNTSINQTNTSINQTNITNQTNISGKAKSILGGNGINRTAMATPSKAAFRSEPVSFPGYAADRPGEGPVMGTPSQAAFDAYVI